ncbi:MAG: ABC transporter permease, partial [Acidobacteriota bacterium]
MGTVIQDFRYAVRVLARSRSFTIAALLTLAVGIGATTAIFSVLYAVVLAPLPYRDPSSLVIIRETDPHNDSYRENASIPDLRDWQEQSHSFERLTGFSHGTATLTDPPREAERVDSAPVLWDLFATLGVQPIVGRAFTQKDDVKNAAPVVIISFDLW